MFPRYDFATRTVHAPIVASEYFIHGYRVPVVKAGRVLAENLTVTEAVKAFGPVTGINL